MLPHREILSTRRDFLLRSGAGFGSLALTHLLQGTSFATAINPLSAKKAPLPAKAKSCIFLFMDGGPSHLDTFDPKPLLNKLSGKPMPKSFGSVNTGMGESHTPILGSKRHWKQHGHGGIWMSDWLPHLGTCADDLAVIRSCVADSANHSSGVCQMNTGSIFPGRPSLGAWVSYGLGTENQNMPAFVIIQDDPATIINGPRNWGSGFMPAVYQGTRVESGAQPIQFLNPPAELTQNRQRVKLEFLNQLNAEHAQDRLNNELDARIASYELAFRMQTEAPEICNLRGETEATRKLYGMDKTDTAKFGGMCLQARRLVESGVRLVQLYSGAGSKWDAHEKLESNHSRHCHEIDGPVTGLLTDLKQRGLLDSTLVVWGGEFGRTPMSDKKDGRHHNPYGFTMWMAGGGVKGGQTIGTTDELGLRAVDDRLHVHDLHATILWLMGLDHTGLTYTYKGHPERATMNEGEPCKKIAG